jgi:hypothetical protein
MDPLIAAAHGLLLIDDSAAGALLAAISPRIDDETLLAIAEADYGMEADVHLAALRLIRDEGAVLAPMDWCPHEVLTLIRWSEPDEPTERAGRTGLRGHLMRAFACAALMRAEAEPAQRDFVLGESDTLAQLLASAVALGRRVQEAAARFLAWRITFRHEGEDERPFFAFALLFVLVLLADGRFPEGGIAALAEEVIAEEARERQARGEYRVSTHPWLLGLTTYNQRHEVWLSHARRLRAEAQRFSSDDLRTDLELIASSMLGE